MKNNSIIFIALSVLLWSCSAAYKNTSTPDDLYYSPAATTKPVAPADEYQSYTTSSESNYLRMKVQNRYQWDAIDDYSYWNDSRYDFGYSCTPSRSSMIWGWNFTPGFYGGFGFGLWNTAYYYGPTWYSWYSPYNSIVYYKNPATYYKGTTAKTNLSAYRNYRYSNGNNDYKTNFYSNGNTNNSFRPTQTNSNMRFFSPGSSPSSSAGGHSGGFSSAGSSAGGARGGRSH